MPIVMIVSQFQGGHANLVVDLKVSVALKKILRAYVRILGTPLFQLLDPPLYIYNFRQP